MTKKLAALSLLTVLVVVFLATTSLLGADRPVKSLKDRATIPARLAPTYTFPTFDNSSSSLPYKESAKMSLYGSDTRDNPETVAATAYDYQHNCTVSRQVEHRNYNYLHFDWMDQQVDEFAAGNLRGIGYQAYEFAVCDFVFGIGGLRVEAERAGYVSIDAAPGGWAVIGAHEQNAGVYYPKGFFDFKAGGPAFGVFTSDYSNDNYGWYENNGTGEILHENSWPKIEWDIDGATEVLHMITQEASIGTNPQTISYYRRVGPYGTGQGTWSDQRVVDTTISINANIASSPISDRVAIVWVAPCDYKRDTPAEYANQLENDVWYAMATDNGADWVANPTNLGNPSIAYQIDHSVYSGGNITTYSPDSPYKAYCNVSALFSTLNDPADELQIVWNGRRWIDSVSLYRRQGAIFHWSESTPSVIRTVARADWDTGGPCFAHAWGTDVDKMSISQCDGKFYVLFTQFGRSTNPCGDVDNVNNVVNGYLYMTVYDPVYDAWDRPQRVTGLPETPAGCIPGTFEGGAGTCNSEYWATMARYGRYDTCKTVPPDDILDILYINDYAPGGCVQTESGVWTINPVKWATYPCRDAVPEPGYSDDAGPGYGLCVNQPILVAPTAGTTTLTLILENFGLLDNDFTAEARIDSGGNGHTTIGIDPSAGTITSGGGIAELTVTIITTGEINNTTVYGTITVTHEAEGSPRLIPVCITVSDDYVPVEYATLSTTCKQLRVYNNGQMANNAANETLDFTDAYDPDDCANVYLFDGSPLVCRETGGGTQCFFTVYDNAYTSDHALRQMTPITIDDANADYTLASMELITADSAIRIRTEYYVPKGDCEYVIEKTMFWNITEVTLTGVALGEAVDWDVPEINGSRNESGVDESLNLIYQYCCANDVCDTSQTCQRYAGIAAYGAPFKNAMTLENDVYVYASGPFDNEAPLPDDTTYQLMVNLDGLHTADLDTCEDLMTLSTFGVYDMTPFDTICAIKILATSRADADGSALIAAIGQANTFLDNHEDIHCPASACDCTPGDANGDGTVNVGDAVYIISYVFKGGPAPTPYNACSGDANGDCACNVGDAVYEISYVFKGGPPPVNCDEWRAVCGDLQ